MPEGDLGGPDGLVIHFSATPIDPGDAEGFVWASILQFPRSLRFEPIKKVMLIMPSEEELSIRIPGPGDVLVALNLVISAAFQIT